MESSTQFDFEKSTLNKIRIQLKGLRKLCRWAKPVAFPGVMSSGSHLLDNLETVNQWLFSVFLDNERVPPFLRVESNLVVGKKRETNKQKKNRFTKKNLAFKMACNILTSRI
jgi:hypothetical protein